MELARNYLVDDEVRAADQIWLALIKKQDAIGLSKILTEDFMCITHNGSRVSKFEFLGDHSERRVKIESIENRESEIRFISPDCAIITGIDLLKANLFGVYFDGPYCFSRVWINKDGQWFLLNFHLSDSRLIEKWRSFTRKLIR